jgi:hypothetical protein
MKLTPSHSRLEWRLAPLRQRWLIPQQPDEQTGCGRPQRHVQEPRPRQGRADYLRQDDAPRRSSSPLGGRRLQARRVRHHPRESIHDIIQRATTTSRPPKSSSTSTNVCYGDDRRSGSVNPRKASSLQLWIPTLVVLLALSHGILAVRKPSTLAGTVTGGRYPRLPAPQVSTQNPGERAAEEERHR